MDSKFDSRKTGSVLKEIISTVVLTILIFLVIRFLAQNFTVTGTSMEPKLHDTEQVMVDKVAYMFSTPARGDVIVFIAPPHPDLNYIKRVIGIPGDTITIHNTTVIVDGVTLNEPYVAPSNQGNPFAAKNITNLVVPPGDYFVLGDNRRVSSDSRDWGFVPRQNIVGRADFVYWPLGENNDGFLHNYSSVFANVHQQNAPLSTSSNTNPGFWDMNSLALICLPGLSALWKKRKPGASGARAQTGCQSRR